MSRAAKANRAESTGHSEELLTVFPTEIGWMGIVGEGEVVLQVLIGHPSSASVWAAVKRLIGSVLQQLPRETDWNPRLRQSLIEYTEGNRVDFRQFPVRLPDRTPFRDKVLAATRQLPYGATTTYGDLAQSVGHPRAARAVGTVMSTNRFPILIPCHRVLAAGGKLGGYTSPTGTDLKQRLLEMEQSA